MLPRGHIVVSGLIGVCVGVWFKSAGCAVISFAAGTLIDIDHVIDYYINYGFTLNLNRIYSACHQMQLSKLYLLFHSYELVVILWISIFIFRLSNYWIAAAIGLTQHMIADQITNPVNLSSYFLSYRMIRRFKQEHIIHRP